MSVPRLFFWGVRYPTIQLQSEIANLTRAAEFYNVKSDIVRAPEVVITWVNINGFFPLFKSLKDNCLLMQK